MVSEVRARVQAVDLSSAGARLKRLVNDLLVIVGNESQDSSAHMG
jgi:hypothetical protein